MRTIVRAMAVLCVLLLAATPVSWEVRARPAAPVAGITERVSVASDGSQGNGGSAVPSISADGQYVTFHSSASNLVSADTNYSDDIFVRDRVADMTECVSVVSNECQGSDYSHRGAISADGQYVAFFSAASNLVADDTNNFLDVFVRDRTSEITERVSVSSDEIQGNGGSINPAITPDGRYVVFRSIANNLVSEDTNNRYDIFVRDRETGMTERVSVASDETQGNGDSNYPSISANGRYVAFNSAASNLVAGDTNSWDDVFVRDREAGTTERVSVASDESQQNLASLYPLISANGQYVVFQSFATNLVGGDTNNAGDIFVRQLGAGITERVSVASDRSQGNNPSEFPSISADGRYVAFRSSANNLVGGDTNAVPDIFVHDRLLRTTERASVASDDSQANGESDQPAISADGRYVAFRSNANNLVVEDTNGYFDVFVRDRGEQPLLLNVYLPIVTRY